MEVTVVCQTCGDIGFEEALVYCDSCKIEAIHRYCVGITPTPFTECITWICEDCDESDCDSIEVDQTANGDSSSLPDHNSGTSKRSDSGFNGKEVDQTDKLRHMSKKKTEKEKNSKNSSSHTPPVLAVEDHGLQDATNVEPVKVSASPIEEKNEGV